MNTVDWLIVLKGYMKGKSLWIGIFYCAAFFMYTLPSTAQQLAGTWIGVHTEWDIDDFCPLPTYLKLDADGSYTLGMADGSASPIQTTWAVQNDTVRLDTVHYAPGLVTAENGLLRIGKLYPMVFRQFTDIALDSALVHNQLVGRVWQSDSSTVALFADGRATIESRRTKQRTAHFWRLARFGMSVFLAIRGNQYNRDAGYKPLWQVIETKPNGFWVVGWTGRAVGTETFRFIRVITPADLAEPNTFQTCTNCFTRAFFAISPGRSARRYEMLQRLTKQEKPVFPGQSGLVRIAFVVNCRGESGHYELTGLDTDYCPKPFDTRVTDPLLTFCRNYVATDATLREPNRPGDRPDDVAITLTFRLIDGRVTDLLP